MEEKLSTSAAPNAQGSVIAVVVYHDEPLDYFRETLTAVAQQSTPPQQILVAVTSTNTAPNPAAAQITELCSQISQDFTVPCTVFAAAGVQNFGQAIAQVFSKSFAPQTSANETYDLEKTWLWLLHADSAPFPETLALLEKTAAASQLIGAVGAKQVFWNAHPDGSYDLLEVGINATRSAQRVPEVLPSERDQGQFDRREDVLAVGTAGMLLRASVYEKLHGFHPQLGPFGDGLELSRRIHLAGARVLVCPAARIRHAQLSLRPQLKKITGRTAIPAGFSEEASAELSERRLARSFGKRRSAQLFNALLSAPRFLFPLCWFGYLLSGIARTFLRLTWRDFTRAKGELQASWIIFRQFTALATARRQLARLPRKQASLRDLEARRKDIWKAKHSRREANLAAKKMALLPDPLTLQARQDLQRHQRRGALFTVLTALVYTVALFLPYFADGTLVGGQLAPDTTTGTQLWHAATNSWMLTGDGTLQQLDAFWILYLPLLLIGQVFGLTLGLAATFTLYLAPVLGAITSYLFAGHFTRAWVVRYFVALLWIGAPAFIEALHAGRIAPALFHACLPLFAWGLVGAWQKRPGRLGIAAIVGAILAASAPIFLLLLLLVTLFALLFTRRPAWLWLPIPAVVFLLPQLLHLSRLLQMPSASAATVGRYFFSHPGVPLPNYATAQSVLRGYTLLPFDLQHWAVLGFVSLALLLVLAALALLRAGILARQVRRGWLLGIFGMIAAVASLFAPGVPPQLPQTMLAGAPWHGIWFSFAWLGLFITLTAGAHGLRTTLRARSFGFAQILGLFAICALPTAVLGLFATAGALQFGTDFAPRVLHTTPTMKLPAIAASEMTSPAQARVLALYSLADLPLQTAQNVPPSSAGYLAQLWRGNGIELHEYSMLATAQSGAVAAADFAKKDLAQAIANLLGGANDAPVQLQEHGISIVLLPPPAADNVPAPHDAMPAMPQEQQEAERKALPSTAARNNLAALLHTVAGLEYVTENETGMFWRVVPENGLAVSARAWISDKNGERQQVPATAYQVNTKVAQLPENGILMLAERADSGWKATLNGELLPRVTAANQWAQAWDLRQAAAQFPAGGVLKIWHTHPIFTAILVLQFLTAIVAIIVALPLSTRKSGAELR